VGIPTQLNPRRMIANLRNKSREIFMLQILSNV
jgi:uncharacterized protein YjiS (DUF1127 family)